MKFRYKRYDSHLRPVIPLKVKYGERAITYSALVDSGADSCLFDTQVAAELGIDLDKNGVPARVGGIAGQTATYFIHPVTIEIGGWPFEIQAGFIPLVAGRFNYGVVGQEGFFDKFKVIFDLEKEEIELRPRQTS